jgi:hypothetical protein
VDDSLFDHPKVESLGPRRLRAMGLWVVALSWTNRWLTDGFIPTERVKMLGGTLADADALVQVGLWQQVNGGYQFHDFGGYNASKAEVLAEREAARLRMRRSRQTRSETTASDGSVRPNNDGTSGDVQDEVHDPRPHPSSPGPAASPPSPTNGLDMALWARVSLLTEELTGVPSALGSPYAGLGAMAIGQAGVVPWERFEAEYRRIAAVYKRPTARQLVLDAEHTLRPTGLATRKPDANDRDDEVIAEGQRDLAALRERHGGARC